MNDYLISFSNYAIGVLDISTFTGHLESFFSARLYYLMVHLFTNAGHFLTFSCVTPRDISYRMKLS